MSLYIHQPKLLRRIFFFQMYFLLYSLVYIQVKKCASSVSFSYGKETAAVIVNLHFPVCQFTVTFNQFISFWTGAAMGWR